MSLQIRYSAIKQYFLLYFLLIFQGTMLFREYNNIILISVIALYFLGILRFKKYYIPELDKIAFGIGALFLIVLVITFGSLDVSNILSVFSRFCIVSLAYCIDKELFATRFVKITVFFSVISLILFAVQCVDSSILIPFMDAKPYSIDVSWGKSEWIIYSTPFFQFNSSTLRNIGICNEPGLYQILLVSALYILLFKNKVLYEISEAQKKRYTIILFATLITTMSLTGLANMIILIACYFLLPGSSQDSTIKNTKIVLAVAAIILGIAVANGFGAEAIEKNIFDKINRISLSADADESRLVSAFADLNVAIRHPLGAGFEVYHNEWKSFVIADIIDGSSCVGLTQWMAVYGFIPTLYLLIALLRMSLRNSQYLIQTLALMLIYINTCCSQPNMVFPALLVLFTINDCDNEIREEAYG